MEDRELLREYLGRQSEQAFAELVVRHVNLVYSTALRVVHEPQMAQDVAQTTFILLARKAKSVRDPAALAGWLYRAASNTAANALRSEQHRHQREAEAVSRAEVNASGHGTWEAIGPLLEEAMRHLKPAEQDALVLRYFEGRSLRDTGRALAITEDAVQKRVSRALDKLRIHFARRGVSITASAIAAVLTAHTTAAAPMGLAASLASTSLASAGPAATSTTASIIKLLVMTKIQAATLGLLFLAGVATPLAISKQASWSRSSERPGRNSATGAGEQTPAPEAARGSLTTTAADAPSASTALSRLRNWLERANHSPLLLSRHSDELYRLVKTLAPGEYSQAWALYPQLNTWSLRQQFGQALMDEWAAVNAPAALAAVSTVPDRLERQQLLDRATCVWAGKDPVAAAAWIKSFYSQAEQASKLMLVFYGCATENPEGARALWQQLPPGLLRDDAAATFMESLAQKDLPAAVACLNDITSCQVRKEARAYVLLQWARTDPAAALAWAQSQPRLQDRDEATAAIIVGVSQRNPGQAAELLKSWSSTALEHERGMVSEVIGGWAEAELNAATAWVKQLPEGPLRERALDGLLYQWVAQAPSDAAAFAQSLPEGAAQAKALSQVACEWSSRNSKAVLGWLERLPEGPARNAVLSGFGDGLACQNPEEAARFVATLPPGDLQAEVALKVVARWTLNDPPAAAAWVAAFPPGQTRERAVTEVMNEWLQTDRPAAEAWRQQNAPTPGSKEKPSHP